MKNGKWTAVAAFYIQNALRQMKADKAGTVFQTAGLTQQPLFGVELQPAFIQHPFLPMCLFCDNNHLLYTQIEAEQMDLNWNFISSSYLMLIRWHQWVDIRKWVQETQLLLHNFAWTYDNLSCETNKIMAPTFVGKAHFRVHLLLWKTISASKNNIKHELNTTLSPKVCACVPHQNRAVWLD